MYFKPLKSLAHSQILLHLLYISLSLFLSLSLTHTHTCMRTPNLELSMSKSMHTNLSLQLNFPQPGNMKCMKKKNAVNQQSWHTRNQYKKEHEPRSYIWVLAPRLHSPPSSECYSKNIIKICDCLHNRQTPISVSKEIYSNKVLSNHRLDTTYLARVYPLG